MEVALLLEVLLGIAVDNIAIGNTEPHDDEGTPLADNSA